MTNQTPHLYCGEGGIYLSIWPTRSLCLSHMCSVDTWDSCTLWNVIQLESPDGFQKPIKPRPFLQSPRLPASWNHHGSAGNVCQMNVLQSIKAWLCACVCPRKCLQADVHMREHKYMAQVYTWTLKFGRARSLCVQPIDLSSCMGTLHTLYNSS